MPHRDAAHEASQSDGTPTGITGPSPADLRRIAERFGFDIDQDTLASFVDAAAGLSQSYRHLSEWSHELDALTPSNDSSRDAGEPSDDPAWAWTCEIQESHDGPLAGVTVAIKDSIAVAGLPTSMGSWLLRRDSHGVIANADATVTRRLLQAGAIIRGKSTTEDLCIGGSSCTSKPVPVDNPHLPGRSAGGSSSGSAVLLARHEVDLALGADQGGSIRIPAALCGVVGLKPTFGLVPFTGVQGLAWGLDHVGPMARDVRTVARALDALAGPDGIDRRGGSSHAPQAVEHLSRDPRGIRVGLVTEGFSLTEAGDSNYPGSIEAAALVRDASGRLIDYGIQVKNASLPWHDRARHIYGPLLIEAAVLNLWRGYGRVTADIGWAGDTPIDAIISGLTEAPNLASPPTQLVAITGSWFLDQARGRSLEQASRLAVELRQNMNMALEDFDVLIHPTTAPAGIAGPLTTHPVSMTQESLAYFHNTCATNITGHPSVSVPAGTVDGAPVGVHITGRHGEDGLVLLVASLFEEILSR